MAESKMTEAKRNISPVPYESLSYASATPDETPCDLCGSIERKPFLTVSRGAAEFNHNIVQCKNCGLIFVSPRRLLEYSDMREEIYFDAVENLDAFMGFYKLLSRWVSPPGRFLDVGCAAGYLINIAQSHGWEAVGVDLWKSAIHAGKRYLKVDIREGTLFDCRFEDNSFNLISMTEFIEHVASPSAVLAEAYRIIADEGLIFLTTPNIGSKSFTKLGEDWYPQIEPVSHLYYFSVESLKKTLEKQGFHVAAIYTVGGEGNDEVIYAFGIKRNFADIAAKESWLRAIDRDAKLYNRLEHFPLLLLLIRLGDHFVNYPKEARELRALKGTYVLSQRYKRFEEHWFFGPIIRLQKYFFGKTKGQ